MTNELCFTFHIPVLRVYAYHGVLPQERKVGAWFRVEIEAEVRVSSEAFANDKIEGTADYSQLVAIVKEQMAVPTQTLEHVTFSIGHAIMDANTRIKQLKVSVYKENPPVDACCPEIGVSTIFNRNNQ